MNDKERFELGSTIRREVLGDEHVNKNLARKSNAEYQEIITKYAWSEVWSRPGLPRHTRSLLNIAMLTALNHHAELALHMRSAKNNGVSPAEIREVLIQTAVYCGVPAAASAFATYNSIFPDEPGAE